MLGAQRLELVFSSSRLRLSWLDLLVECGVLLLGRCAALLVALRRCARAGRGSPCAPRRRRTGPPAPAALTARARAPARRRSAGIAWPSHALTSESARRGGSSPTPPRRCPAPPGAPCRSSPPRSALSATPSSTSDFSTASARFWPSARLYSRPPRSSVWPSIVSFFLRSASSDLRVCASIDRPELVLHDEAVEVEVDRPAASAESAVGALGQIDAGDLRLAVPPAAPRRARRSGRRPCRCGSRPAPACRRASRSSSRPSKRTAAAAADIAIRRCFMVSSSDSSVRAALPSNAWSAAERPPHRLAHIVRIDSESRLDFAIERGGHQHVAPLRARGIDDQTPVRREARALVVAGVADSACAAPPAAARSMRGDAKARCCRA